MESWDRLLNFPTRCLRTPRRGGHRRSLATEVNKLIEDETNPPADCLPHRQSRPAPKPNQLNGLASRVASKLEEGDYKGAVRLACSEDSIATLDEETISVLKSKHPPPHPETDIPPLLNDPIPSKSVSEDEVAQAIGSFPNGSAGGPDGLRPQHLKDLTSASVGRKAKELLQALTSFVNHILNGRTPHFIRSTFFGASLIALHKKDGGIRPIAVGLTLRRLVAKCASRRVLQSMGSYLAPLQLDFGSPRGAEAAAHAARMFLNNAPPDHLLVKLDFKNAFNSLRRDKMLEAVKKTIPELFPFVHSAYEKPSSLFCGEHTMLSAEGIQQGDPLGPLLFCLTIHPICLCLRSEFKVFYLDDGTIGGSTSKIREDFQQIETVAAGLGLQLNHKKCELICRDQAIQEASMDTLCIPGLQIVSFDRAELLGSPIGSLESIEHALQRKCELLKLLKSRLCLIHSHDALLLLRHSFSIPKVLYILWTAPCFQSPSLEVFDDILRTTLSDITNVCLDSDSAWSQASLPIRAGGLGIRRTAQLAPSAFLASAAGCSNLINQILPAFLQDTNNVWIESALSNWQEDHDDPPPSGDDSHLQKIWDRSKIRATYEHLLNGAQDPITRARLLAVATKESGAWLTTLPLSSVGLRMDDNTIRVAVGLRLGAKLCEAHKCSFCGNIVDDKGLHSLSCRFSKGRHPRHSAINNIIKRSLDAARIPSQCEPLGLSRSDGKRPDGASIVPWKGGKTLVWDVTCPDTLAPSYTALSTREAGAVAEEAERRKNIKYAHLEHDHHFIPVAVESLGVFSPQAKSFIEELGRRLEDTTTEPLSRLHLRQRISVAVQRGNSTAIAASCDPP